MRQTRTDYLNALIPAIEARSGTVIEYRPFRGWFLDNIDSPRHFGDEGDWMGANWREAEKSLRWIYAESAV